MTTENNKNDPCRGSDTKREQAKDSDPDHIALEGLIGREGLFGGGEGQAMSEIQAKAQTPANGLLSQVFDLQLSETFLDTSNPDYFDEPTDKAYNWPPKTLTDITKPTKVFRQLEDIPFYANRPVRIGDITDTLLLANPRADLDLVNRAYVRAAVAHKDKNRHSGEPYLSHPLAVAGILAEMGLDDITVAAGLLHDTVEDTTMTIEDLVEEFGPDVARIVNGVTKIAKFNFTSETERQAINLRKIIIAMLDDLRVIFVKLADRLHNMRTLGYMSADKQAKISRETLDFFAPLASRLGIHKIQAELEDLALFYLNPIEYETIRNSLSLASKDRKNFVSEVKEYLAEKMKEWNINCEIEGRPKHIYSIHKKMVSQNLPIEQIYDLVAFRIIVSDVQSCYTTLCVIHQLFKPIPGRFKDYINLPKSNGYQSLHTAVIGLHKYRMEIQIRTKAMHQVAEEGVAAHWRYKEGTTTEELARINALRSRLNWQSSDDPKRFLNDLRESLATDEFIIVMTPDGKPIDLPVKATVLDFAYAIHTSIGHHCHAARVNDANYPIREKLETGDVVRIITSPKANVKPDWLHSVVTAKARQRIRQYLANENKIALTEKGEQIIKNVMARNKL
ncbi:MAG: RelA/SpoT family protein, partial [Deltaproteobacteria bacterium]|nr:RelA/SpoT family protein [Deltaproteobacteria bacterium]